MWEKFNKEEKNNKFQRLKENEIRTSLENVEYTDVNVTTAKSHGPIARGLGLSVACLLFIFIATVCIRQLWRLEGGARRSLWHTAAHVHVHTYQHLARLTPPGDTSLAEPYAQDDKVVSCYYNFPNESKNDQLMPHNIHPHLCTHINVAFARIVNKEIALEDHQWHSLRDVVKLKQNNPKLKILLSIGGSGNDKGFSDMVVNHASRKIFIKSIKYTLRNFSLDGVDLDWEFPALHKLAVGGRERQHFSQLLREIRMEYFREKRDYILTIATAAPETIVNISYDVDQINQYVDFVNIMTYDYHFYTKYTPFTGLNSPLYPRATEQLYLATLNVNYTVHMYLDKGLERSKIVVGIPTYGHTFTLVNANNPRVGSPAAGFGSLSGGGFINYPDVCIFLKNFSDVTLRRDAEARVPYLYRNKDWVSYDTPESVMEKARFIKDNDLRGAMIYSLNADDYAGVCSAGLGPSAFPLAESVRNALLHANSETSELNYPRGR